MDASCPLISSTYHTAIASVGQPIRSAPTKATSGGILALLKKVAFFALLCLGCVGNATASAAPNGGSLSTLQGNVSRQLISQKHSADDQMLLPPYQYANCLTRPPSAPLIQKYADISTDDMSPGPFRTEENGKSSEFAIRPTIASSSLLSVESLERCPQVAAHHSITILAFQNGQRELNVNFHCNSVPSVDRDLQTKEGFEANLKDLQALATYGEGVAKELRSGLSMQGDMNIYYNDLVTHYNTLPAALQVNDDTFKDIGAWNLSPEQVLAYEQIRRLRLVADAVGKPLCLGHSVVEVRRSDKALSHGQVFTKGGMGTVRESLAHMATLSDEQVEQRQHLGLFTIFPKKENRIDIIPMKMTVHAAYSQEEPLDHTLTAMYFDKAKDLVYVTVNLAEVDSDRGVRGALGVNFKDPKFCPSDAASEEVSDYYHDNLPKIRERLNDLYPKDCPQQISQTLKDILEEGMIKDQTLDIKAALKGKRELFEKFVAGLYEIVRKHGIVQQTKKYIASTEAAEDRAKEKLPADEALDRYREEYMQEVVDQLIANMARKRTLDYLQNSPVMPFVTQTVGGVALPALLAPTGGEWRDLAISRATAIAKEYFGSGVEVLVFTHEDSPPS